MITPVPTPACTTTDLMADAELFRERVIVLASAT